MPIIKRYSNRKLYDVDSRHYINLDEVGEMIRRNEDVRVVDHDSGADLTIQTLVQVILDQEKRLGGLFPRVVLSHLIQLSSSTVTNLRNSVQAFLEPTKHAEDEIIRRLQILVGEGEMTEDEGQNAADLLLASRFHDTSAKKPAADVNNDPVKMEQLKKLELKVSELEAELEKIQKR
jgi:polyhydroxyalkanoate synthesis repressor PhaR